VEPENFGLHWAVLKHVHKGDGKSSIAKPGEDRRLTALYSPLNIPFSDLGDFGLGYGLYFSSVRDFAILLCLAGLVHLPVLLHYASDAYSGRQEGVEWQLKGSTICTERSWVPCPNCSPSQDDFFLNVFVAESALPSANFTVEWMNITEYRSKYDNNGQPYCDIMCQRHVWYNHGIFLNDTETVYRMEHNQWRSSISAIL